MSDQKQFTVTVPQEYYDKLETLRKDSTWSRSLIVREALKDFLNKYSVEESDGKN